MGVFNTFTPISIFEGGRPVYASCGCYYTESMNDHELLQRYSESRCEASFTELVARYVDLVYSSALRQVGGDAHLAHDVTQSVFIDLARKAGSLSGRTVLAGWLYTSAHYAAAKVVRTEQRWHAREQEANSMREISSESDDPIWEELRPVIDEAMHELNQSERDAVLLRFFEKRQLSEVGVKLGVTEDAARKRVDRALEKLRGLLASRGVTSTSAALVAILGANTVAAAPVGMAASIAGTAIASTAVGTGGTLTILKIMAMSKLKVGLVGALVVVGVATPLVIQNRSQSKMRTENEQLRQQNTQLTEQMTPLTAENARLSNLIAQATDNQSGQQSQSNEILKLRGEVARLRQNSRESSRTRASDEDAAADPAFKSAFQKLVVRATQLRQSLEQHPEQKIPELALLTEKDWLDAVGEVDKPENDPEFRQAMSNLRNRAKGSFGNVLQKALRQYAEANGDMLPTDLSQLQQYFNQPVDDSVLKRYQLIQSGKLSDSKGQMLISEIGPRVDDEYDSHFEFSLNGISSRTSSVAEDSIEHAITAYANANGGLLPKTTDQVAAYLPQQVDPTRVQKMLAEIPSNVTTLEQLNAKR
jgi:RNA polymerase sigma factor (sigma-70 family)